MFSRFFLKIMVILLCVRGDKKCQDVAETVAVDRRGKKSRRSEPQQRAFIEKFQFSGSGCGGRLPVVCRHKQRAVPVTEGKVPAGAHDEKVVRLLDEVTARMGVAQYMECIYGVDNLDGASKLDRALELMSRIAPEIGEQPDVVLIGDALHDKEVADALKVRCVLCGQGSHAAWRLAEVAPTGATLLEAVDLALAL